MDAQELRNLQEAYQEIYQSSEYLQEDNISEGQLSAYAELRKGPVPAVVTDKSVSSAVDKALEKPGTPSPFASETPGRTGITGSGSISYSGGSSNRPSTPTRPTTRTAKPTRTSDTPVRPSTPIRTSTPSTPVRTSTPSTPVRTSTPSDSTPSTPPVRTSTPPAPPVRSTRQEQVNIYNTILSYLLDEGYAETLEAAEAIMNSMSEEWRDSIIG